VDILPHVTNRMGQNAALNMGHNGEIR